MHPAAEPPATPVLVVAEPDPDPVDGARARDPQFRIVAIGHEGTKVRSIGGLVALVTALFGFLAVMAFGWVGGLIVVVLGTAGHAVGRFVQVRRLCPIERSGR